MAESPKSPSPSLSPCSVSRSARHARFPKGLSLSPLWRRRKERKRKRKRKGKSERDFGRRGRQYRCSYSATAFALLPFCRLAALVILDCQKEGRAFVLHKSIRRSTYGICYVLVYTCLRAAGYRERTDADTDRDKRRRMEPSCRAEMTTCRRQ